MPITEWLTPKFFDVNVILVTLMINWTIYAIVSNFLVDFHVPLKIQAANYFGVVIMTAVYFILTAALSPIPTIYPNKYDWLLIGNGPVLGCVIGGVIGGSVLAWFLGEKKKLLIGAASAAVVCEALIVGFMLLWILSQE
jgi:hypothetical protein